LAPLLEAQFKDRSEAEGRKPRAALIAGVVVLALIAIPLAYSGYLLWEWSRFLKVLRQQPGIVVMSYAREGGRYHIQGFRDPLAANPEELLSRAGIDPKSADLELKPFYSLEDDIVLKRANLMLHPPPEVKLTEKDGVLRAEGIASPQFIARFEERAPWIAGITSVDDSRLENFNLAEMNRMRSSLESAVLLFPIGRTELESGQEQTIASAQNDIRALITAANHLNGKLTIDVIGHTDVTGVEGTNLVLSKQRADVIFANLVRAGVKPENLHPRGVGTSEPLRNEDSEEGRRLNRSVTFKVAFSPIPPVN
jgi:outer membrane protein OmpA-like peptidoglycan-associated protein